MLRNRQNIRILLAVLLTVMSPAGSFVVPMTAQFRVDDRNIYFSHVNSSGDGLSYNCVNTILEDAKGFIWVGTSDGLNRYDGCKFRVYGKEDLRLNSSYVVSLYEDSQGIWIGTDSGVARYFYDTGCIKPFEMVSDKGTKIRGKATVITSDDKGRVWFAVNEQGLFCYDEVQGKLFNYFGVKGKRLPANVRSIYFFADGRCWVSLYYHNLYSVDWKRERIVPVTLDGSPATFGGDNIVGMTGNLHGGVYLVSARHGICEIDSLRHLTQYFYPGEGFEPESMTFDSNRRLWVASLTGVYEFNTVTGETKGMKADSSTPFSISENFTHAVLTDRNSKLWVGTNSSGLDRANLRGNNFHKIYVPSASGHTGAGVTGISVDTEGNMWCSTMRSGIMVCRRGEHRFYPFDKSGELNETFSIRCIGQDVWASSLKGIYRINRTTGSIRLYDQLAVDSKLMESRRSTAFETSGGDILIGTTLGIYSYSKEGDTFSPLAELNKYYVTDVVEDVKGNLWIATFADGLIHYDLKHQKILKRYRHNESSVSSLPSNKLLGVMRDNIGRIWTASFGGGVSVLDEFSGTFRSYIPVSIDDVSASNVAYSMVEDEDGKIWVSTNKGLMQLDPVSGQAQMYTVANGLLNNDFASSPAYRDSDGYIYFCSTDGVTIFNPQRFKEEETEGEVIITSLSVNGREISADTESSPLVRCIDKTERVDLPYGSNSLAFTISDLGRRDPAINDGLYYKFEGYDDTWKPMPSDGYLEYSNLPPGDYRLRFRREKGDSVDTQVRLPLDVHIAEVFYKTKVARCLYILLIAGGAVFLIHLYHRRSVRRERQNRENMIHEQEVNAYNEKMALFSSVANRLRSPLALIRNPLKNILRNQKDGGDLYDDLMVISHGADRLSLLLQDFTENQESQPEQGRQESEPMDVDLPGIMIVENSLGSMSQVSEVLANGKYKVSTFDSHDIALEMIQRRTPDLVIIEAELKGMSGSGMCREIHAIPGFRNLPVIIAGHFPTTSSQTEAMDAGAELTLPLPAGSGYLESCVNNVLSRSHLAPNTEEGRNSVIFLSEGGDFQQISDSDAEFIRQFDAIVMENIGDSEFGNEQLAARLCMSKSTLTRRTRSLLNTTPNDYILNKRLAMAAKMLRNSGCRINEVCYTIGFNTPSYFTKCFKRVYGMLPTEYRDKHNVDSGDEPD